MNWDAIGTIGEIVGSIAVVVSLIYVSLQIKHANKQSEIDSLRHTWDSLNQICDRLSESTETAAIINRGRASLDSLNDDERMVFEHLHLRILNTLESWYLQVTQTSKPGPYLESQLANLGGVVAGYLDYPGTRELWESFRHYFEPIADIVDANLSRQPD